MEEHFSRKINEVMDFIDEHVKEKQGVFFLIKMVLESYEIPKNLQDEYERMKHQCCDKGKNEIIDSIVEEGVREGTDQGRECFSAESRSRNPAFCLFYVPHRSREKNGA